jgi:uncharacterized membrane protein
MTDAGTVLPFIDYLKVVGMSMLPVWELRGSIMVAYWQFGMPILNAYFLALLGSCIPAPFILLFIKSIIHWMQKSRVKFFRGFSGWLLGKVEKNREKIQKYAYWALFVFVAIPLPGTGVWTGSLLGAMLDLKIKKALPAILAGNAVAGVLILLLTLGIDKLAA